MKVEIDVHTLRKAKELAARYSIGTVSEVILLAIHAWGGKVRSVRRGNASYAGSADTIRARVLEKPLSLPFTVHDVIREGESIRSVTAGLYRLTREGWVGVLVPGRKGHEAIYIRLLDYTTEERAIDRINSGKPYRIPKPPKPIPKKFKGMQTHKPRPPRPWNGVTRVKHDIAAASKTAVDTLERSLRAKASARRHVPAMERLQATAPQQGPGGEKGKLHPELSDSPKTDPGQASGWGTIVPPWMTH